MANVLATFASQKEEVMDPTTSTDAGLLQQNLEKRTHEDQLTYASKATPSLQNCCILLISFDRLQLIGCIVFVSELLSTLCSYKCQMERDKPFYVGAKKASISRQLLLIKLPDIVGRLPRSLEDMKYWKATELKN